MALSLLALLAGLIFDDNGNRMTPSHSCSHKRRYRYYVSQAIKKYKGLESYIIPEIPSAGMGALGLYDRELFGAYENTGFNPDMISIWSAFGGNGELYRYNEERRCECAYGYRGFEYISRTDEVYILVSYKIGDHNNTDMRVCMKGILGDREYDYRTDWPDEPDPEERLMIRGDNYFVGFEANWLVFSKYAFHIDPYTAEYTVLELN